MPAMQSPTTTLPKLLSIAVLLAAQTAQAQNNADIRYIQGSWVNVRSTVATDSAIASHITTNTRVSLKATHDKTCEIAWGDGQHGFVPCKLLGDRPLTLAEVGTETVDGQPNPQYAPARAFWIAPSMASLFAAGKGFQTSLLTPEQLKLENGEGQTTDGKQAVPRLTRYPVPEFDAMKAELTKGIVAPADVNPPLMSCKQLQAAEEERENKARAAKTSGGEPMQTWLYPHLENYPFAEGMTSDCHHPSLPNLRLPAIKPSLFKSTREIAPGSAGVERIGANFGIGEHGRVTGGPKWELDYDISRYTGAWDIGRYELTLDKPVVEHVIGRTGLVGAYQWTPQLKVTPYGPSQHCDEGLRNKRNGKQVLAGYPNIKDELLWFQAPAALSFHTAKVKIRTEPVPADAKEPEGGGIRRIVVYEVDLDGDGVPDFVQWDIWSTPQVSGPDPMISLRRVYVNINGEWYPFDEDAFGECT